MMTRQGSPVEGQIFVSHSGKDREIVDAITKSFDGTGVGLLIEDVQVKVTRDGDANWLSCPANDYVARVLAR